MAKAAQPIGFAAFFATSRSESDPTVRIANGKLRRLHPTRLCSIAKSGT